MKIKYFARHIGSKAGILAVTCAAALLAGSCALADSKDLETAAISGITLGPQVPSELADPSNPQLAAAFAWQEFIALTWPAAINPAPQPGMSAYLRGQPSTQAGSGGTGAGGTTVWETFYHRVELYPGYSAEKQQLPDPNQAPNYLYRAPLTKATPETDLTLFNNLDEASEIGLAQMYHTPFAEQAQALVDQYPNPTPAQAALIAAATTKAALLYEAKGNPTIFNYVKMNSFNNLTQRSAALAQSVALINNQKVTAPAFQLPAGSIEIKATWRRYDSSLDNLDFYHWTNGIYYTNDPQGNLVANNDKLLLVGLHIIHKTPNVPTFTFATFEHVSNEVNGFRFTNTGAGQSTPPGFPRALPDAGIITAVRQFPIPGPESGFDLNAFNLAVQAQVRSAYGQNNVWANYRLIGVQALVQDNPGGPVPAQQFFLSNFATETNDTLQFFQGALNGSVPDPSKPSVSTFNPANGLYKAHNAGGCVGCHGAAGQAKGGDFSVIATKGNRFAPEAITPYPGGPVVWQNAAGFPLKAPGAGRTRPANPIAKRRS
jgi:mono/diheme cytochrome c family protein